MGRPRQCSHCSFRANRARPHQPFGKRSGCAYRIFKVLLAPFATPKRAIAFIYKNEGGQKVIERQAVSVDEVEALTGLDFFSSLPDEEENEIEKTCDYYEWNN